MSGTPVSSNPGKHIESYTPHDSNNFDPRPRALMVGAGSLVIVNEDDTTTTIAAGVLATGVFHPISPKRINATGTTATQIYGIY